MSAANSLFQEFGGLDLPLAPNDFADGLSPLDPAKHALAELFKAAINAELGGAWSKLFGATNAAGLATGHPLRNSTPVTSTLELEPSPQVMKQWKAAWPLLCVHRMGTGAYEAHTLERDRLTQPWAVHYILGPLDVGDAHKFLDACVAAAKVIRLTVRKRGHLAYQSGAIQFGDGPAKLTTCRVVSHEGPGQAQFAGDDSGTLYYAITINLESTELSDDNEDAFPPFQGASFEVGVGGAPEGIVPSLIYALTDDVYQQG